MVRYRTAYVIATGGKLPFFWRFLDKEIGHIALIMRDVNGSYVLLDPRQGGLQPLVIRCCANDKQLGEFFRKHNYKIIKLRNYRQDRFLFGRPAYCSCVSFIKHALGIWSWAITPRQLWYKLIKDGAIKL